MDCCFSDLIPLLPVKSYLQAIFTITDLTTTIYNSTDQYSVNHAIYFFGIPHTECLYTGPQV